MLKIVVDLPSVTDDSAAPSAATRYYFVPSVSASPRVTRNFNFDQGRERRVVHRRQALFVRHRALRRSEQTVSSSGISPTAGTGRTPSTCTWKSTRSPRARRASTAAARTTATTTAGGAANTAGRDAAAARRAASISPARTRCAWCPRAARPSRCASETGKVATPCTATTSFTRITR